MSTPTIPQMYDTPWIDGSQIDLSYLVGRDIGIFCDQMPGKEIKGRVTSVQERSFFLESGNRLGPIDNLVHNQQIVVQFNYRGEEVSVRAMFRKSSGGRAWIQLDQKLIPLSQRRHVRVNIVKCAKLAPLPISTFTRKKLSHLRWIETETINFSSGGSLLEIPSYLEKGVFLLLNVEIQGNLFPSLILAQVKHCHSTDEGRFHTGVEFIVKENATKSIPLATVKELPQAALSYSVIDREKLNKVIQGWRPESGICL